MVDIEYVWCPFGWCSARVPRHQLDQHMATHPPSLVRYDDRDGEGRTCPTCHGSGAVANPDHWGDAGFCQSELYLLHEMFGCLARLNVEGAHEAHYSIVEPPCPECFGFNEHSSSCVGLGTTSESVRLNWNDAGWMWFGDADLAAAQ